MVQKVTPPSLIPPTFLSCVELLRDDADPAGRLPEASLVRQLLRRRCRGDGASGPRLRRRALRDVPLRPRGSGDHEAGPADGAEAVPRGRPRRPRSRRRAPLALQSSCVI